MVKHSSIIYLQIIYDNHILNKKFKSEYTSSLNESINPSLFFQRQETIFHPPYEFEMILLIESKRTRWWHNRDWRELTNSVEIEQLPSPHPPRFSKKYYGHIFLL